jgi:hypothetical protein
MMSLGMSLPRGDITQSSIHGTQLTEIDFGTSHNQSKRKSVELSIRGPCLLHFDENALASRMLIDQLTPHLPKDNKEVNAHVKRLQAMLHATTVVDPTLDRHDETQGHDLEHR